MTIIKGRYQLYICHGYLYKFDMRVALYRSCTRSYETQHSVYLLFIARNT
jgi:hypothetical protein